MARKTPPGSGISSSGGGVEGSDRYRDAFPVRRMDPKMRDDVSGALKSASPGSAYVPDPNEDTMPSRMETRHTVPSGTPLGPGQTVAPDPASDPAGFDRWRAMAAQFDGSPGGGAAGYGSRLYSDDIFPGRQMGTQRGQTTRIGQYGGSPIFVSSSGLLPFAMFTERRAALAEQQKEIEKQAKETADRFGYKKPEEAEYIQPFNQWAEARLDEFMGGVAQVFAGSDEPTDRDNMKAMKAVMEDPNWSRKLQGVLDEIDAKRLMIDDNTKYMRGKLEELSSEDRSIDAPQWYTEEIMNVLEKQGEYATMPVEEFAKKQMNLVGKFKAYDDLEGQAKMALEAGGYTSTEIKSLNQNGWAGLQVDEVKKYEAARENLKNYATKKYGGDKGWYTQEQIDSMIDTWLPPPSVTTKLDEATRPSGGGSGSSEDRGTQTEPDWGPIASPGFDEFGDMTSSAGNYMRLPLRDKVGNKKQMITEQTFSVPRAGGGPAEPVTVIPTELAVNASGHKVLVGYQARQKGARVVSRPDENGIMQMFLKLADGSEQSIDETNYFDVLAPVHIPYEPNKEAIKSVTGISEEEVNQLQQKAAQKEGRPTQAATKYVPGYEEDGYRFKGGDPTDSANWEQIK